MTDTDLDLTSPTSDLPVRNSDADDGGNVERFTLELQQISNAPPGTITEVNQSPPKLSSIPTGTNAEVSYSPPRLSSVQTPESSVVFPDLLEPGDDSTEADDRGESRSSTLEFKQGSNPPPGSSPKVTHSPPRLSSIPTPDSNAVNSDLLAPGDDPSEADDGGESRSSTLEFKQGSNPPPGKVTFGLFPGGGLDHCLNSRILLRLSPPPSASLGSSPGANKSELTALESGVGTDESLGGE